VTGPARVWPAEQQAKAALIEELRANKLLKKGSAVVLELAIANYANRADVALVSDFLHCYEIKTKRDTLTRLDSQVKCYGAASDFVTVVAATKHINTILTTLPAHVGISELVDFGSGVSVRHIRDAAMSPTWSAEVALSLLPVVAIRAALLPDVGILRRPELIQLASALPPASIRGAVTAFLRSRFRGTTTHFLSTVRSRNVRAADLAMLKLWGRMAPTDHRTSLDCDAARLDGDAEVFAHVGRSFGPVPDEIRQLLGL
jgi:hypothetical protein